MTVYWLSCQHYSVRDLGVVDQDLSLASHVSHVTSVCFLHLRQLRLVRRSLTTDTTHALVRALIHCRLDYCNGVLAGMPVSLSNRLQSVLRAAARLVLHSHVHCLLRTASNRVCVHCIPSYNLNDLDGLSCGKSLYI